MSSKVGIAVFGFGNMGKIHVRNCFLSPRINLKWIVCENIEEAETFATSHCLSVNMTKPENADSALNDKSVDAVIICSPTDTHEHLICKSINAGKDVLCEKPITYDIKTTKSCFDLADEKKKVLMCAFHRRFDPSFSQVHDNIKNNVLGNMRLLKISSHDTRPPPIHYIKASGGILSDSTIHDLDMSLWLTGSKPTSIYVQSTAFDEEVAKYDSDLVVVTVMFENGVISVIDNGRQASYGYHQELEVLCDRGAFHVTNRPTTQLHTYGSEQSLSPQIDQHFSTRYTEAYKLEVEHFIDVLQGLSKRKITGEEVLAVNTLVEAGKRSMELKAPVKL